MTHCAGAHALTILISLVSHCRRARIRYCNTTLLDYVT